VAGGKLVNCAGANEKSPVDKQTILDVPPVPAMTHFDPFHAIPVGVPMYGIGSDVQFDPSYPQYKVALMPDARETATQIRPLHATALP
jgi:hypothetical protein